MPCFSQAHQLMHSLMHHTKVIWQLSWQQETLSAAQLGFKTFLPACTASPDAELRVFGAKGPLQASSSGSRCSSLSFALCCLTRSYSSSSSWQVPSPLIMSDKGAEGHQWQSRLCTCCHTAKLEAKQSPTYLFQSQPLGLCLLQIHELPDASVAGSCHSTFHSISHSISHGTGWQQQLQNKHHGLQEQETALAETTLLQAPPSPQARGS